MNHSNSLVFVSFCMMLLSGCASMSGSAENGSDGTVSSSGLPDLYEGEPEVVFATEFPVESAEEAVARADRALQQGDIDLALYMYVRAYDMDRDNTHALTRIGEIHESRGNNRLATQSYLAALRTDEANDVVLESLGLMYLQVKRYDEAEALLRRAVLANPTAWRAHNGIGIIADLDGQHEIARQAYDVALDVNPNDASILNNRGYSLYLSAEYEAAAEDFVASATQGENRAWLNLGLVRARQQRYSEAVRMMDRAVAIEVAYNDVGYIAMRQGDLMVAANYFQKALDISPRYFEEAERNLNEVKDRNSINLAAGRLAVSK
jgi:Tfp pilus assembly protein PilF